MKIEALPSPNFNDRKFDVDMLVLHYTGMETGQAALDRMRDPEAEVSAHYMVWEDGRIVQLVGEDKRAWHAGVSSWQGDSDLNSRSIGIEIVNGGHDWPLVGGGLPPYPDAQIEAVIALCQGILSRWDIPQSRIVGHSDIAPARKDDPGEHFPWFRVTYALTGFSPYPFVDVQWFSHDGRLSIGDTGKAVSSVQKSLREIGYAIEETGQYDETTQKVVTAFQRRWLQDNVTGEADMETTHMINAIHSHYVA